jgi:hypothetical protein
MSAPAHVFGQRHPGLGGFRRSQHHKALAHGQCTTVHHRDLFTCQQLTCAQRYLVGGTDLPADAKTDRLLCPAIECRLVGRGELPRRRSGRAGQLAFPVDTRKHRRIVNLVNGLKAFFPEDDCLGYLPDRIALDQLKRQAGIGICDNRDFRHDARIPVPGLC